MATQPQRNILCNGIRMVGNAMPEIRFFTEANSQTFVAGDLVYSNSGALTICGSDPSSIAGIALAPGTNVTSGNTDIPVLVLHTDVEVIMNLYHGTAASATYSDESGIGVSWGIVASSGKWYIDMTDGGNTRVTIQDYYDPKGDYFMRCYVKFLTANLQFA